MGTPEGPRGPDDKTPETGNLIRDCGRHSPHDESRETQPRRRFTRRSFGREAAHRNQAARGSKPLK